MAVAECQDLWPGPDDARPRAWFAWVSKDGSALVRKCLVAAAGETLVVDHDYPETWRLSPEEWARDHETVYGLALDGQTVAALAERRAAWRKLRRYAAGDLGDTEADRRAVVGAIRRILRDLATEVAD